ncbi:restriction endonuclease [Kribbella sp. NPDC050459]|uniref:restriction endonuclease n=1 Tax=Kribbella sp. NPDC050459 TaxID=3155785 RepID=UPI0033D676C5
MTFLLALALAQHPQVKQDMQKRSEDAEQERLRKIEADAEAATRESAARRQLLEAGFENSVRRRAQAIPPLGTPLKEALTIVAPLDNQWNPEQIAARAYRFSRVEIRPDERIIAIIADGQRPELTVVMTTRGAVAKRGADVWRTEGDRTPDPSLMAIDREQWLSYAAPGMRPDTYTLAVEVRRRLQGEEKSSRGSGRGRRTSATRPVQRLIRDARDAELVAAEWMRFLGFADATVTPVGADAGIDIEASKAVAQVKMEAVPTGRPALQQLHGAAVAVGKRGLFFSLAGYTPQASAWAEQVGIPLFRFDLQGVPEPVNSSAGVLLADAGQDIAPGA